MEGFRPIEGSTPAYKPTGPTGGALAQQGKETWDTKKEKYVKNPDYSPGNSLVDEYGYALKQTRLDENGVEWVYLGNDKWDKVK